MNKDQRSRHEGFSQEAAWRKCTVVEGVRRGARSSLDNRHSFYEKESPGDVSERHEGLSGEVAM
jgi:hypothetical protein